MIHSIRARLDDLAGPDPSEEERALLARLVRSYAEKTPAGLAELAERVRQGDPGPVREQAHSLKGSASNIGADRFAAILAVIEDRAAAGAIPDETELLDAEWTDLAQDLTVLTAELGG
jgi:HPt (histidine-containing phosphotransfer) domain-containing protein